MSEHWIRLRGGWEWREPESGLVRRATLPTSGPFPPQATVHLVRAFNRPPVDPERETVTLRLDQVRGIVAVRLNGREIARPEEPASELSLPLDQPLPARNELTLVVRPTLASGSALTETPWGAIALVIRRTEA